MSLFDGISCGMLALKRAGIPVKRYVAYEIEKNAIKISQKNYPQIKHCKNPLEKRNLEKQLNGLYKERKKQKHEK